MRKNIALAVVLLTSSLAFCRASTGAPSHPAEPSVPVVHLVYLAPNNRPLNLQYQAAVANAGVIVQHWLWHQLGGRTVTFAKPVMETFRTQHGADWYSNHKPTGPPTIWDQSATAQGYPAQTYWYQDNIEADAAALAHARRNGRRQAWIILIDAPYGDGQLNGSTGGLGVLTNRDLAAMIGESDSPNPDEQSACSGVGGLALYLSYALGAVSQFNFRAFPNCSLGAANRAALIESPFIRKVKLKGAAIDCAKQPLGKVYAGQSKRRWAR
ncbi:MAG TPA: hypothetical protein VFJ58_29655 [Armatimonadota bacterium]|nr:hypothetical protein [Armatimonadota bacterium]